MVEEKLIGKIRKLILLSKHNENENEAALAAAKAQELLIMHNLSIAEIELASSEPEEQVDVKEYDTKKEGRKTEDKWKIMLAFSVSKANLCKTVHHSGYRSYLSWIGKPSNVEVAIYMFETLVNDIEFFADRKWRHILRLRELEQDYGMELFTDHNLRRIHGRAWKNAFYDGAVFAISSRLQQGKDELRQNENVSALILHNDDAINKFIEERWNNLRSYKYSASYGPGYGEGVATGNKIQFKRGINGAGGSLGPNLISDKNK